MLFAYQQQVERLLHDTQQVRFNIADLIIYINEARVQIALAGECIRQPAQLTMVQGQQAYAFSDAVFTAAPTIPDGLGGVANVRSASLVLFSTNEQGQAGQSRIPLRSWEYFDSFHLSVAVPTQGPPIVAARLQPGLTGTLWFAPPPDLAYTINLGTVAYPAALNTDADAEVLPQPWQAAVAFYAGYLALLQQQQMEAAGSLWGEYEKFQTRATQLTTPSRTPHQYPGGRGSAAASEKLPLSGQARRR